MPQKQRATRNGLSLAEILAVVTLIGILAAILIPRFGGQTMKAKRNACFVNKGNIEVQVQLWYRNKGTLPAANLSDIGADGRYFPEGIPTCPVDGSDYQIDTDTGEVRNHAH